MDKVTLNKLSIQNFKAFGEMVDVPIRPITLIFGENSAGKSSILHSFLFLEHVSENGILHDVQTIGGNVDLGGAKNYVHNQNAQHELQFAQTYTLTWESGIKPEYRTRETSLAAHARQTNTPIKFDQLDCTYTLVINPFDSTKTRIEYVVNGHTILQITNMVKSTENPEYYNVTCTMPKSILDNWGKAESAYSDYSSPFTGPRTLTLEEKEELDFQESVKDWKSFNDQSINSSYDYSNDDSKRKEFAINQFLTKLSFATLYQSNEKIETITFDIKHFCKNPYIIFESDVLYEYAFDRSEHNGYKNLYQYVDTYNDIGEISQWSIDEIFIALSALNNRISNASTKFDHIGPLRVIPERYVGLHDDNTSKSPLAGNVDWEIMQKYPDICDTVNEWFVRLQIPYKLKHKRALDSKQLLFDIGRDVSQIADLDVIDAKQFLERYYTVNQLYFENTSGDTALKLSPRDLGVGVSQVIPVIVACVVDTNATTLIEQPELHLHPRLQGDLADLFIDTAIKGDQHNTYIIETHSEHIIRRLMRRIREDRHKSADEIRITKDDVSILYVAAGPNGSTVTHLRLDDEGDLIDEWPNGFFEESFRDDMAGR